MDCCQSNCKAQVGEAPVEVLMSRKKFRNDFEAATKNSVANYKLVQVLTSKKKWWSNMEASAVNVASEAFV